MNDLTHLPDPASLAESFAEDIWKRRFKNTPSKALIEGWKALFHNLNQSIELSYKPSQKPVQSVLALPTGSGKTQATKHYLKHLEHEGVLVVTFLKDEANKLAQGNINSRAYHSDNRLKTEEINNTQILIITHNQYLKCLHDPKSPIKHYQDKPRTLTIIDESLSNIKAHDTNQYDIQSAITKLILIKTVSSEQDKHPLLQNEIDYLESLKNLITETDKQLVSPMGTLINYEQKKSIHFDGADLSCLEKAVSDKTLLQDNDNTTDYKKLSNLINRVKNAPSQPYLILSKVNNNVIIRSCDIIQTDHINTVILDATAPIETLYRLKPNIKLVSTPNNIRSYRNVTLHLSEQTYNNSKSGLKDINNQSLVDAVNNIIINIFPDAFEYDRDTIEFMFDNEKMLEDYDRKYQERQTLLITDKATAPKLESLIYQVKNHAPISIGYWGNLTGKNDYKDYSTVIILTLPFKPEIHTSYLHLSTQRQVSALTVYPETSIKDKTITEERQSIKYTNMSAEVIQAINRIRCRNVIDDKGNCKTTDIYMIQNTNNTINTEIINNIKLNMPDIQIKTSSILDLGNLLISNPVGRPSKYVPMILHYLQSESLSLPIRLATVGKKLNISQTTINNLTKKSQLKSDNGLEKTLTDNGYRLYKNKSYYIDTAK